MHSTEKQKQRDKKSITLRCKINNVATDLNVLLECVICVILVAYLGEIGFIYVEKLHDPLPVG